MRPQPDHSQLHVQKRIKVPFIKWFDQLLVPEIQFLQIIDAKNIVTVIHFTVARHISIYQNTRAHTQVLVHIVSYLQRNKPKLAYGMNN